MTRWETRKFLNGYKRAVARMRQARANIEKLRTAAESTTVQLTGMPGGGQIGDKVGSGAARIADAEAQFRQMELDAIETMAEIVRVIDMVENPTQAEVLHRYHIEMQKLTKIADEMHYSLRWIDEAHRRGVDEVTKILNNAL